MRRLLVLALFTICLPRAELAIAHELRPAYLEIREMAADEFAVTWKVPAMGDRRLGLHVRLPDICKTSEESAGIFRDGAYFERWKVTCQGGLKGREIAIDGLHTSLTDVLARVEHTDGSKQTARLTPEVPRFAVVGVQTFGDLARTYLLTHDSQP